MDDSAAVTSPIRVVLLDDHGIVRRGIADLIESAGDLIVVGEAGTARLLAKLGMQRRTQAAVYRAETKRG